MVALQLVVNVARIHPEVQEVHCVRVPLEQEVASADVVLAAHVLGVTHVQPNAWIPVHTRKLVGSAGQQP